MAHEKFHDGKFFANNVNWFGLDGESLRGGVEGEILKSEGGRLMFVMSSQDCMDARLEF